MSKNFILIHLNRHRCELKHMVDFSLEKTLIAIALDLFLQVWECQLIERET